MPKRHLLPTIVLFIFCGDPCMAVEQPAYSVQLSEPPYEIREYAPTTVAVVHVEGDRSAAVSAGFRLLAGYIFGANQSKAKIAMTAPVMQTPAGGITVTAADGNGSASANEPSSGWTVRFTMPAAYTMGTLPAPDDVRVQLRDLPRHRAAALTFSGFWSDSNLGSHESQLLQWVRAHKFTIVSAPSYAYYDPPWTPWFLRKIEVLVDIAPTSP